MKLTCFCTLSTGLIPIDYALQAGVKIDKVIGLNPESVNNLEKVSGFVDISDFCIDRNISYEYVDRYNLRDIKPEDILNSVDLIWVNGWQRLLPKEFINFPNLAVIGAHGSCDGITKGRGRSPQNWAIIIGAKNFQVSLFKISEGIDDGDIVTTESFDIMDNDSILSSYLKSGIACAEGIIKVSEDSSLIDNAKSQNNDSEYFPKRVPEDSFIDWNMTAYDIFNQVRALSDPYPNSRTILNDKIVYINKCSFFDYNLEYKPGQIIFRYPTGEMIVGCKKGVLIINDYRTDEGKKDSFKVGQVFESINMQKIVDSITERFRNEFPGKKLNSSLEEFWKMRGYL